MDWRWGQEGAYKIIWFQTPFQSLYRKKKFLFLKKKKGAAIWRQDKKFEIQNKQNY